MALSKITYATKTALNPQPSIADENKVTDANMNEIKSVVNNAIDQVDENTTNIGDIAGTILWTNPNPTSSFSAQNITLSSSDYDVLEIFYLTHYQKTAVMSVKTSKGKGTILQSIFQYQDSGYVGSREMVYNSPTSVSFVDNVTVVIQQTFNRSANNDWNIPLYIVGYKTGLFS